MKLTNKVGYSAVAAAVSLACGTAALQAATIVNSGSAVTFSLEGNTNADPVEIYTAGVTVTLAAAYLDNDTVSLDITNGDFFTGTSTVSGVSAFNSNVTCGAGGTATTLGFLSRSASTANYRVSGPGSGGGNGNSCAFSLPISRTSLDATGRVSVAWSARTGVQAIAFDESAVVATIGTVASQFPSVTISQTLDGTVDVNAARYLFTGDNDTGSLLAGNADTLTIVLGDTTSQNGAADVSTIVATISGDFSFIDNDGSAGCTAADLTSGLGRIASTAGTTVSINSTTCSALTFTATAGGTYNIAFGTSANNSTPTNGSILDAPQTFTMSAATYSYSGFGGTNAGTDSGSVALATGDAPGAWTLNGASVNIGYMPYGTGISRIVYLTNRSTQAGAVTATAINSAGEACEEFSVTTAGANSVTLLSTGLDAGVAACYGADYSGRVAFTIVANVPGSTAEVYSAYNVNGDRVAVVNDTNGRP